MDVTVTLRPTEPTDLDFVIGLERHADNKPFIGQWTREGHAAAIARPDREHWIISHACRSDPVGYLIAYNLVAAGYGVYVKRIVVADKSQGIGRAALQAFVASAAHRLRTSCVWLTVFAENERGQRAYRAVGFTEPPLSAARRAELCNAVGGFSDRSLVMATRVEPALVA
jgi:RimJ/RimL family protein N-acetyltransferase